MLTLGKTQLVLAAIVVFILLPTVLVVTFPREFEHAYLRHFVRPDLEREFGFRSGTRDLVYADRVYPVLTIASMDEGGVLERSGVRIGDVPLRVSHLTDADFYRELRKARTAPVNMRFIDVETYLRSIDGDYREIMAKEHTCVISLGPQ